MKQTEKTKSSDSILYQLAVRSRVAGEDPEIDTPLRVLPYNQETVQTRELATDICRATSMTEADVEGVLVALGSVLRRHLLKGDRVVLKDIGTFSLALGFKKMYSDGHRRRTKTLGQYVSANDIEVVRVVFSPDNQLCDALHGATFESSGIQPDKAPTLKEVKKWLREYFSSHLSVTRIQVEHHFNTSRHMATKHINQLVNEGLLVPHGIRNSRFYTWNADADNG